MTEITKSTVDAIVSRRDEDIQHMGKAIAISTYTTSLVSTTSPAELPWRLIFAHGASGSMHTPAVANFSTGAAHIRETVTFQGNMNLKARVDSFLDVYEHFAAFPPGLSSSPQDGGGATRIAFGGRSMGARAAVIAATTLYNGSGGESDDARKGDVQLNSTATMSHRLVLVSYPLVAPNGTLRDDILYDLPPSTEVLFIIGTRDSMCPLDQLETVRGNMVAATWLLEVQDADHGMNVKGAKTAVVANVMERTGRIASEWLDRDEGQNTGRLAKIRLVQTEDLEGLNIVFENWHGESNAIEAKDERGHGAVERASYSSQMSSSSLEAKTRGDSQRRAQSKDKRALKKRKQQTGFNASARKKPRKGGNKVEKDKDPVARASGTIALRTRSRSTVMQK